MKDIIDAINKKIIAAEKHCADNRKKECRLVIEGNLYTDNENPEAFAEYKRLKTEDMRLYNFASSARNTVRALEEVRHLGVEL